MIKGRYVAQIEVDFQYSGDKVDYKTVYDRIHGDWIDNTVEEAIGKVFRSDKHEPVIKITKQYADVTEIKENEE